MVKGFLVVFLKYKKCALIVLSLLFSCDLFAVSNCRAFVGYKIPPFVGRLVTLKVEDINLDLHGLLGGTHYIDNASFPTGQVGVRYMDKHIESLVAGRLTQTLLNQYVPRFLSGRVVEDGGDLIIEIDRHWDKEPLEFEEEGAKVLNFPTLD